MHTQIRTVLLASVLVAAGCAQGELELGGTPSGERDDVGSIPGDVQYALRALPNAQVSALHKGGVPAFLHGDLGRADLSAQAPLQIPLEKLAPVFRLKDGNLVQTRAEKDERGRRHVRFQQMKDGLLVVGGELVVHLDETGLLYAVNSTARDGVPVEPVPSIDAAWALEAARALPGYEGFSFGAPALKYVQSSADNALHLAWALEAEGFRGDLPARDTLFIDAHSGALAERHPRVHTALNRKVYTSNNTETVPGTLKRSEGGAASSDPVVNKAYDHTGTTYNFYKQAFGRDSYNGSGATLASSVHFDQGYNNAYWDGTRMVYGDGDGWTLLPLANSLDITSHELTHAVTDYTAGLVYQNEPGALNEAMSDIMAAATDAFARGTVDANTWLIGEDIFTPSQSGDALRYMADPTKDGDSRDYYPLRYQGSEDYGGVHLNSGIANLAFKLLVTGGAHPRGRSNVQVTALGMEKARAIFYRALAQYMTSTTNFAGARAATKQAATELYGAAAALAVEQAWAAVGVGAAPSGGTTGTGTGTTTTGGVTALQSGAAVSNVAGGVNEERVYTLSVPAGASNLKLQLSGGTGDADLYVKFGAKPTVTAYDYRPYLEGNNELVTVASPAAGTWYVVVRGFSAYSGATLVGSFGSAAPTSGSQLQNGVPVSGLSGAAGSERRFTFVVPQGATQLSIGTEFGTGDADLYVRFGAPPSLSAFDHRPYLQGNDETVQVAAPAAGTVVHVLVHGYSAYSGLSIGASAYP